MNIQERINRLSNQLTATSKDNSHYSSHEYYPTAAKDFNSTLFCCKSEEDYDKAKGNLTGEEKQIIAELFEEYKDYMPIFSVWSVCKKFSFDKNFTKKHLQVQYQRNIDNLDSDWQMKFKVKKERERQQSSQNDKSSGNDIHEQNEQENNVNRNSRYNRNNNVRTRNRSVQNGQENTRNVSEYRENRGINNHQSHNSHINNVSQHTPIYVPKADYEQNMQQNQIHLKQQYLPNQRKGRQYEQLPSYQSAQLISHSVERVYYIRKNETRQEQTRNLSQQRRNQQQDQQQVTVTFKNRRHTPDNTESSTLMRDNKTLAKNKTSNPKNASNGNKMNQTELIYVRKADLERKQQEHTGQSQLSEASQKAHQKRRQQHSQERQTDGQKSSKDKENSHSGQAEKAQNNQRIHNELKQQEKQSEQHQDKDQNKQEQKQQHAASEVQQTKNTNKKQHGDTALQPDNKKQITQYVPKEQQQKSQIGTEKSTISTSTAVASTLPASNSHTTSKQQQKQPKQSQISSMIYVPVKSLQASQSKQETQRNPENTNTSQQQNSTTAAPAVIQSDSTPTPAAATTTITAANQAPQQPQQVSSEKSEKAKPSQVNHAQHTHSQNQQLNTNSNNKPTQEQHTQAQQATSKINSHNPINSTNPAFMVVQEQQQQQQQLFPQQVYFMPPTGLSQGNPQSMLPPQSSQAPGGYYVCYVPYNPAQMSSSQTPIVPTDLPQPSVPLLPMQQQPHIMMMPPPGQFPPSSQQQQQPYFYPQWNNFSGFPMSNGGEGQQDKDTNSTNTLSQSKPASQVQQQNPLPYIYPPGILNTVNNNSSTPLN